MLGVIVFLRTEVGAFDEEDALNGMTLAGSVAIAMKNARLYEQARQEIAERRRAEKELQESEERFRGLFEGIPACCWTFDREGMVLDWNRTCEELYGWSAEQAIGKTMYSLMVKDENVLSTQEKVAAVQVVQDGLGVAPAGDGVAQGNGQLGEDRGL